MQRPSFGPLRESATPSADVLEYIPKAERDKIPDEDFAGPDRTFPINTQAHLDAAAHLIGHAADPAAVKRKAIAIAKRKGFKLPDAWKEDGAKESAFAPALAGRSKIATITTCFLQDDAVSLNGRQYKREAVDRLIQSAQTQLSDPNGLPVTSYISHEAADQDDSLKLVGKVTRVWREGNKAMAAIDIANTQAGRDVATLAHEGFLQTLSLRASNAEIKREKDSTWPTVGGSSLHLDGIDFTATPGISVAKIQNVALAENASEGPRRLQEVFKAHPLLVETEQKGTGMDRLNEADQGGNTVGGYAAVSGNSPSMAGPPSQGAYGRMYQVPEMTSGEMQGMSSVSRPLELQEAHDRIAMVQGRSCAPSRESARWRAALATLLLEGLSAKDRRVLEAGRALNRTNDGHLDVAHDSLARHMKMECVGESSKRSAAQPASDGMQDGDDDDYQSARPQGGVTEQRQAPPPPAAPAQQPQPEGESPMTEEEALKLLESKGYGVQRPKTQEELLREQMAAEAAAREARLAALEEQHKQEMAELRALLQSQTPEPQRKSRVLGSNVTETPTNRPLHGKYLQEQIRGLNWQQLADRTAPLPTDKIPLDLLMKQFEHLYALQYDVIYDPQGTKYQ